MGYIFIIYNGSYIFDIFLFMCIVCVCVYACHMYSTHRVQKRILHSLLGTNLESSARATSILSYEAIPIAPVFTFPMPFDTHVNYFFIILLSQLFSNTRPAPYMRLYVQESNYSLTIMV